MEGKEGGTLRERGRGAGSGDDDIERVVEKRTPDPVYCERRTSRGWKDKIKQEAEGEQKKKYSLFRRKILSFSQLLYQT